MDDDGFIAKETLDAAWERGSRDYIYAITDAYLQHLDGGLTEYNMDALNANQHALLAYRYILDEVMEGGWIQLIQNGLGNYVLAGPFAMLMKKQWGLEEFGKYIYKVRKEYLAHKKELEAPMSDEEFMALYEQYETMNELGDAFLDDFEEQVTPSVADYVRQNEESFV